MSAANSTSNKTEFRKSNSSTSCFSDDTEFLEVPKPVAAHSKKQIKNYKATKYLELQIMDNDMENGRTTPPAVAPNTLIRKERPRRFHQKCKSPAGRRNKSPSVSEKTFDSTSCTSKWSSSEDDELSGYNDLSNSYSNSKTSGSHNGSGNNSGSERRGRSRRKIKAQSSLNNDEEEDGSTCGDEDFHWVKTEPPSEQRTVSPSSSHFTKDSSVSNGMPPRPPGSLDRRRQNPKNRNDRDAKSRSSHSLREKKREYLLNNFHHSNDYLHQFGGSQFMLHEHPSMPCLLPNGIMGCSWPSRDNLLQQQKQQQKNAENMFHSTQDLMQCCNRYPFLSPAAAAMYCHCNYPFNSTSTLTLPHMMCPTNMCGGQQQQQQQHGNKRPDSDERYRRLQSDKEALALQVQVLSEQVSLQNEKIVEMERLINEKNRLISNAEDLLQREILSRSSLETQKLELLTAMSELKLHNTALDHENQELRVKCFGPTIAAKARQQIFQNNSLENSPIHRSHGSLAQSANLSVLSTPKTPPAAYRQKIQLTYNSLPRQIISNCIDGTAVTEKERKNVAFADSDKYIESNNVERRSCTPTQSPNNLSKESGSNTGSIKGGVKSLKSIFGKMKRSGSGNLEDLSPPNGDDFKRGGVRATAGPRLGYNFSNKRSDKAFREYGTEDVCAWLDELGLEVYIEEAKRWLKNGASELIQAGPEKIEKELNLKSPLHKKKIILALADVTDQENDELFKNAGKLDLLWVLRWLEDIGLPQYKDAFTAAKMDGRMLHRLSMDDLNHLHISSCLHVASLRRGIQLMRKYDWSDEVLIRRSESEDRDKVQLWTAHRVWDWLRVVDLAEYAPNLRGSGVHGALMMLEPKFTSELLADLLSIPPSKTLLRRHLSTHFKELLGRETIQVKRDAENTLGYQPLTLYSKIKKKSQFSLIRKRSFKGSINETDTSDLVCPMTDISDDDLSRTREKEALNNSKDKSGRMKMTGCLSPQ